MSSDTMSDVVRAVRLQGAVYFFVDAADPWVAEAPPAKAVAGDVATATNDATRGSGLTAAALVAFSACR